MKKTNQLSSNDKKYSKSKRQTIIKDVKDQVSLGKVAQVNNNVYFNNKSVKVICRLLDHKFPKR